MTERVDPSLRRGKDEVFPEVSQVCLHKLSLLLNVAQSYGKPLPVGSYTERMVSQMIDRVAGGSTLKCDHHE